MDDCIVDRVMKRKIHIVATNDRDLKRTVRKVPGVPIRRTRGLKWVFYMKERWYYTGTTKGASRALWLDLCRRVL
jgi:hypothetical protein